MPSRRKQELNKGRTLLLRKTESSQVFLTSECVTLEQHDNTPESSLLL